MKESKNWITITFPELNIVILYINEVVYLFKKREIAFKNCPNAHAQGSWNMCIRKFNSSNFPA